MVIASLFEKRAAGLYHNTAAVIDADGSLLGIYRKMHIPDDPLYYEKFYFTPGDLGFRAWQTRYAQDRRADLLGPMVSRGGAPDRAARGGDALLPDRHRLASGRERPRTASSSMPPGKPSSVAMPSPTAAMSPCPTASGTRSLPAKASSSGARASSPAPRAKSWPRPAQRKEETLIVPLDLGKVDVTRTHWPFLRDRRIDAYDGLTKRLID